MQATIENDELCIRVPLEEPKPSSSGKTLIVASSHGNQLTQARLEDGRQIVVGLNCYVYATEKKPKAKRVEIVKAELAGGGA